MYLAPGFVDLHVHGGDGADFMDGTAEAFRTVCRCHARHGTTSLTPTSTVAPAWTSTRASSTCAANSYGDVPGGARIVGLPLLRPVLRAPGPRLPPGPGLPHARCPRTPSAFTKLAAKMPLVVTVAPEIDNAEWLVRTYRRARRAVQRRAQPRHVRASGGGGRRGACGTSITCSARCPTGPGCGNRKPSRCAAASWRRRSSSTN